MTFLYFLATTTLALTTITVQLFCLLVIVSGHHLFRPLCAVLSVRGLRCGGSAGGDKLRFPPPPAAAANGQHRGRYAVPCEQHNQSGHIRGVPHQHAGLDDPLAGAEQGEGAPVGLHPGQCGHGHHDRHEYRALLSTAEERLFEEQHQGNQEGEGDVRKYEGKQNRRITFMKTLVSVGCHLVAEHGSTCFSI